MIRSPLYVEFVPSGRGKAKCQPDALFPDGKNIDISQGLQSCAVELPYPAPECGFFVVRCQLCEMSVAVTVAGRPDDPRTLRVMCKLGRAGVA